MVPVGRSINMFKFLTVAVFGVFMATASDAASLKSNGNCTLAGLSSSSVNCGLTGMSMSFGGKMGGKTGMFSGLVGPSVQLPYHVLDKWLAGIRMLTSSVKPQGSGGATVVASTSPVPLPAAGWMLLVGAGGLVAMRRKKRA